MDEVRLVQTNIGMPKRICFDDQGADVYSSIDRQGIKGVSVYVTWTGIAGDQPTNTRLKPKGGQIHGGHDKAVYAYPVKHYDTWHELLGANSLRGRSFGENLCVIGANEETVHIGDEWEIGNVRLRITKPRLPCRTLRYYFNNPNISRMMFETGLCRWYLEVLQPGVMFTRGTIKVTKAPGAFSIAQAFAAKRPS